VKWPDDIIGQAGLLQQNLPTTEVSNLIRSPYWHGASRLSGQAGMPAQGAVKQLLRLGVVLAGPSSFATLTQGRTTF
jgi:hypothetical protein